MRNVFGKLKIFQRQDIRLGSKTPYFCQSPCPVHFFVLKKVTNGKIGNFVAEYILSIKYSFAQVNILPRI